MLKLEGVNRCLGSMGEAPLNALTDTHTHLGAALGLLDQTNREVQAPGRWFNAETLTLTPSPIDKGLYLPGDCLEVNTYTPDYVQRGNRIYNLRGGTYEFDNDLRITLIRLVDYEQLPEVPAAYVGHLTVLRFQTEYDGDSTKTRALAQFVDSAMREFGRAETRNRVINQITSHPLLRGMIHQQGRRRRMYMGGL